MPDSLAPYRPFRRPASRFVTFILPSVITLGAARCASPADRAANTGENDISELTLSVREIVERDGLLRRRVRVSGRCVPPPAAATDGPPPIRAEDWLLESDGARVFVNGPYPNECGPVTAPAAQVTTVAEVAEDTTSRRFLLLLR